MAEAQFNNGNDQNDYPVVIRSGYTNYKRRWRQQTVKNGGLPQLSLDISWSARTTSYVESNFKPFFFLVYIDKRNYTVGQNGLNIDDPKN